MTQIAFLLYPDMTAVDPYEVLARRPGANVMVPGAQEAQATA